MTEPWWRDAAPSRPRRVAGGIQIHSTRGAVAQTWWSARFIEVLESLGVGGRLARGRTYARAGQILELQVDAGAAVARVQGSRPEPYRVRVGLATYGKTEWAAVEQALADDAWYAATLLAGGMPPEIEQLFGSLGLALFPASGRDLSMDCSCPDHAVPCKHLAAVFYLLAEHFDADPFEVLALRGRDRETLLANLRARRGGGDTAAPATADDRAVPLAECLDAFFTAGPGLADVDRIGSTPTPPDALLDQLPAFPIAVREHRVTDLLRPAYRALGEPG
ncbi:SWIM zinc finger family protein [Pseudonocardia sp. H11422]|uniref:SWIM zinc finger family protein n=1 Tax=Pseudonocardia sp. H11422 TaxID=2835866 RepID=UPI001BDCDBDC|nr:SWIM zinc finger family protein [Pseudonocardia sp. H11422]